MDQEELGIRNSGFWIEEGEWRVEMEGVNEEPVDVATELIEGFCVDKKPEVVICGSLFVPQLLNANTKRQTKYFFTIDYKQ